MSIQEERLFSQKALEVVITAKQRKQMVMNPKKELKSDT